MKIRSASALALAAAVLAAPFAAAHADTTPGWYLGAGVGGTFTSDATAAEKAGDSKVFYDPGWNVNGSGGYSWGNWRAEGEVWHSLSEIDAIHGALSNHGHLSNTDLFANGLYDFSTGTMWTPYVGAGAGLAFVNADHIGTLTPGGSFNGSDTEFAYQAIAGVAAQLDDHWALTADYRYVAALNPEYRVSTGGSTRTDDKSHNIVVGLRYSFGTPEPEAPIAQVTPPPAPHIVAKAKPVVAPIPQSYMVFFDYNKAVLTPEAKRILASAAGDFKKGNYVKIVVTGHTDTVGSIKYNQKLSETRAAAVKAELERLGVKAAVVQAVGAGKNGLLVPTADGVREAQNRRAEIVFDKQ